MANEHIKELVKQLQDTLPRHSTISQEEQELLLALENDIEKLLANTDAASSFSTLQKAAIHFEESHPRFSAVLAELTQTLGNMGI